VPKSPNNNGYDERDYDSGHREEGRGEFVPVLDRGVSGENAVLGKVTAVHTVLEPSGERTLGCQVLVVDSEECVFYTVGFSDRRGDVLGPTSSYSIRPEADGDGNEHDYPESDDEHNAERPKIWFRSKRFRHQPSGPKKKGCAFCSLG
jgi:hypothetical protein